ncbi:MAG: type I-C CRISPR-associated protein Cas5 [Puniceicoccaceae bacterium]|nr:MAG: type I-C CRISPR-associated protein Cas5 [Puniceicoccaceae bacterium]
MRNEITYKVYGRYALFTDPVTKLGGEKCSYHIPTYEALKGITKSIYWKPSIIWIIDKVRVMKAIRTEAKNVKPISYSGIYPSKKDPTKKKQEPYNTLAIYTYLADVEYQVSAHFVFNPHRQDLKDDFDEHKHHNIARRMVEKGGRRDVCLGARECQAYVEPVQFGEGEGYYDNAGELAYGHMFHGFDYPDEIGKDELHSRFWRPVMRDGIIEFPTPDDTSLTRKFIRKMNAQPPRSVGLAEPTLRNEGGLS